MCWRSPGRCAAIRAGDDLRLILFGGEEQGLHGSISHVAGLPAAERARIARGRQHGHDRLPEHAQATVLLEGNALSQAVIDGLAAAAATYTDLAVQTSLDPFGSDHVPFIDAGIPAVLTIEGTTAPTPPCTPQTTRSTASTTRSRWRSSA